MTADAVMAVLDLRRKEAEFLTVPRLARGDLGPPGFGKFKNILSYNQACGKYYGIG
jgi:hypothetical protein